MKHGKNNTMVRAMNYKLFNRKELKHKSQLVFGAIRAQLANSSRFSLNVTWQAWIRIKIWKNSGQFYCNLAGLDTYQNLKKFWSVLMILPDVGFCSLCGFCGFCSFCVRFWNCADFDGFRFLRFCVVAIEIGSIPLNEKNFMNCWCC